MNTLYEPQAANYSTQEASFLSQVFAFFGLAILTSAAGTYAGFNFLAPYFIAMPSLAFFIYALELILVFSSRAWSTIRPLNYLLFALFAFMTGLTLVPLLANIIYQFGGPDIIIKALVATTLMFSGTAIFGWVTKKDLSGLSGFLWISLIGMIIVSIVGVFWRWSSTFEMIFAGFGVVLFSAYTMYDIQKLKTWPRDRAVDAALHLYLDIFNLFIFILRLIGGSSRN